MNHVFLSYSRRNSEISESAVFEYAAISASISSVMRIASSGLVSAGFPIGMNPQCQRSTLVADTSTRFT